MGSGKQALRINKAHHLFLEEKTGNPSEFANKLNISRSQLYNLIGSLKEYDAPIKYCKKINSFYYLKPFFLVLKYSLKIILDEENKEIFGGNNFRPILLDGSMFTLQYQNSSRENLLCNN